MPLCIICHEEIESDHTSYSCPNGHPAHDYCLKDWMLNSQNCPLCTEKYSAEVLSTFSGFLKSVQAKEEEEKLKKIEEELIASITKAAAEIFELQQLEKIHELHDLKEFEKALQYLFTMIDNNNENNHVLFLIGKTFFLKEQFDLAINYFMKLVKKDYYYPEAFLYMGKSYEALGLEDKAKWAYERVPEKRNSP